MRLSNTTMIHGICTRWYHNIDEYSYASLRPAKPLPSNFITYRVPLLSMHL